MYAWYHLDETKLFNLTNDQPVGSIEFTIKYNGTQLYQGEKLEVFESLPQK